jgi:hypothetical protein
MAWRIARRSRPLIALALASLGPAACSPPSPTGPSSQAPRDAAAPGAALSENAASTGADSVRITRGTLAFEARRSGSMTLQGSKGFRFDGSVISGLEPTEGCSVFNPCQPGTTIPFALSWVGTDIPGTVRLQGEAFPVGSADTGSLSLELSGSFVAPAHVAGVASVTVPFTVGGLLLIGDPLSTRQLTGRGQVTFTLEWQAEIGGWGITFASFDFGGPPH